MRILPVGGPYLCPELRGIADVSPSLESAAVMESPVDFESLLALLSEHEAADARTVSAPQSASARVRVLRRSEVIVTLWRGSRGTVGSGTIIIDGGSPASQLTQRQLSSLNLKTTFSVRTRISGPP